MNVKASMIPYIFFIVLGLMNCSDSGDATPDEQEEEKDFYFGADLSYVNQVLDHNGVYRDQGETRSPYRIFKDHGANLVRLRLWHNPAWTKEVYGAGGTQGYNDLADVEKSIRFSKEQGMQVLLDFHYSDTWADPGKQEIPAAWKDIKDIAALKDSVYEYTFKTLKYLDGKGLMPELVQIGNETNCGMLYTNAPGGFPACNVCNGQWQNFGAVVNRAIDAVKAVTASSSVKTKIILHVADPKNVTWWFDNLTAQGNVTGFDIIGFSCYPIWHNTIAVSSLGTTISGFKSKYNKGVMILETAYPWTNEGADGYNNVFGSQTPVTGYPFTVEGQRAMLRAITQQVKDGGGVGVVYWEPAWISSEMKDLWGTGSSWENNTFFDFEGNILPSIGFMKDSYQ